MSIKTIETTDWLSASQKTLYDGVLYDLGLGEHRGTHTVPLHMGRVVLNNTSELDKVSNAQQADLGVSITDSSVVATLSNVRQKQTGDRLGLRGMVMSLGKRGEAIELEHDMDTGLPVGYTVELVKGQPYQLKALSEDGLLVPVDAPDGRIVEHLLETVATVIKIG